MTLRNGKTFLPEAPGRCTVADNSLLGHPKLRWCRGHKSPRRVRWALLQSVFICQICQRPVKGL